MAGKKVGVKKKGSYVGFAKLEKKIAAKGGVSNPGAVAASIGREKYGSQKFQKAASEGKSMKGTKPQAGGAY